MSQWLAEYALDVCADVGIPMQLETGLGTRFTSTNFSDKHVREFLDKAEKKGVKLVLLHAGWPNVREAARLAAARSNVWLDVGGATPYLSTAALREMVRDAFSIAPLNKIMASTGAHSMPEAFYCSAKRIRGVVAEVLQELVDDGDLTQQEAVGAGVNVLHNNALRCYAKIDLPHPLEVPTVEQAAVAEHAGSAPEPARAEPEWPEPQVEASGGALARAWVGWWMAVARGAERVARAFDGGAPATHQSVKTCDV
ncbi:unnamed protein product [Pedinophyceae sp. YPF-701]|nr:unnamed protein product [Pedinophyceae sp. YPF-701]